MNKQETADKIKPTKKEKIEIGSTIYIVNSYNDNYPKDVIKEKVINLIKMDIAKNT